MATDFGRDISGTTDVSATLQESEGLQLMREVAVRRLFTPDRSLLSAPDEQTVDLRIFCSADFSRNTQGIRVIESTAQAALQADPRILSAQVTARWLTEHTLEVLVSCDTALGPFQLTLAVNAVTIEVLAL